MLELKYLFGVQTIESNVNLTQIVQFVEGSVLFVGTEHGAIRAYDYPLTGMLLLVLIVLLRDIDLATTYVNLESDNYLVFNYTKQD